MPHFMYPIHHPVHTCTVPPILERFLGSDLGHASPPLQILISPLWLSLGAQFSLTSPRVIFSLRRFCAHSLMSTTTFTLDHIDRCFTYGLCDSLEGSRPFWPQFSEEEKPACFWWSSYASQSVCNEKPSSGHRCLWACGRTLSTICGFLSPGCWYPGSLLGTFISSYVLISSWGPSSNLQRHLKFLFVYIFVCLFGG